MGARCVLIEGNHMGGDCLNYGCVPSKALLAAGKAAQGHHHAAACGVQYAPPAVPFKAVHDHVHGVIANIAPNDSQERFEGLGVQVLRGHAAFTGPRDVDVSGSRVRARRFVIATGSTAAIPPIPGLAETPYLTNETIFDLTEAPEHLIVIGGGPIGTELGQAFAHLGSCVSIVEMSRLLPASDPDAADVLRHRLQAQGVALHETATVTGVERAGNGVAVTLSDAAGGTQLTGSHLLVAAGRRPVLDGLGLDAAGIAHSDGRLVVDARLRTSNKRVFAAGDVAGGPQFTHVAGYHAGIVIKNALFRLPAKADHSAVPAVTYTSPEIAAVGLTAAQAKDRHGDGVRVLTWPFADNDRAQAERDTSGFVKAVTTAKGRILGCTIVGAHAGELIQPWLLALQKGLKIGALAQMIAPYPTLGEASKRAAGGFYTERLFAPRTRRLVRLLQLLG